MGGRGRFWYGLVALLGVLSLLASACGGSSSSADGDGSDGDSTTSASSDDSGATTTTSDSGGESSGGEEGAGGQCEKPIKAAFVYVGPIGDAGWTKKHDDGRQALEAELGDCVETSYLESIPEGAESEAVFDRLARENDVIFGTSFGYMDQMLAVAEKYPDVVFEHATGFKVADNMGTYFGAAEEARYLSGMAAGAVTETNQIGYVAAFPIPEVLRGINAFTLGAQRVNPDVTVSVVWTSTWFDPTIEKEAAESLLNGGADVIAQHQDTPAAGEAAQAAGAHWIGYNDDMSRFAPDAWLTAPVWDWGPFYISTVKAVADGTWSSEQYYGNMADGMVQLSPVSETVDEETRNEIDKVQSEIVAGTFKPFTGPIEDQDGNEIAADGVEIDLGSLLGTDYLVKGVQGSATG